MPPGNFAFLTPVVTPRPQNRPRKTGKLTPGKNPSTTGSAGRSDPARDASSDPGPFTCLFFTPPNLPPTGRVGCFLFFLPNSPLCGPNRPLTGRSGRFPHLGQKPATRGLLGPNLGLGRFCGTAGCGGQCRKERKGRKIPLEGRGRNLRHLPGLFQGCKEAMRTSVLFSSHTICRRFYGSNHKMSKCTLSQFAPLHPLFFSQPIPLVGQADGLYIAS